MGKNAGALGHVLGIVSDTLQICADLDHGQDQAQVNGRGRAQCDDAGGLFVDDLFERVDRLVRLAHGLCALFISGLEADGGLENGVFHKATHLHDLRLNGLKITVESGRNMLILHMYLLSRSGR